MLSICIPFAFTHTDLYVATISRMLIFLYTNHHAQSEWHERGMNAALITGGCLAKLNSSLPGTYLGNLQGILLI